MKATKRSGRLGAHGLWLALACVVATAGCAPAIQGQDTTQRPKDLPPPRLVDESLTCEELRKPESVQHEQPEYTEELRRYRVSGSVVVRVIITTEGTIRDPQVVRASDRRLIDPVLAALERWRYRPATCDGVPVEMVFHVSSQFRVH